ncbi:unnamed protein product [Albugo candida]|uniref:Uncharacterized protein n=1 Tax=Albugo candida TaxID=65357 RepID=A0A024FWJ5_9STRA|nr:unnamed protein product [Albugo candida]|eukprot:CCI11533.1 unnamed protein product [Albugo candida]
MEDLDFFPKKTDISETYLHSNNDFELLLCNIFEVHSTDFTSDLRTASAFCVGQGYSTAYLSCWLLLNQSFSSLWRERETTDTLQILLYFQPSCLRFMMISSQNRPVVLNMIRLAGVKSYITG